MFSLKSVSSWFLLLYSHPSSFHNIVTRQNLAPNLYHCKRTVHYLRLCTLTVYVYSRGPPRKNQLKLVLTAVPSPTTGCSVNLKLQQSEHLIVNLLLKSKNKTDQNKSFCTIAFAIIETLMFKKYFS